MDLVLVTGDSLLYERLQPSIAKWGYRVILGRNKKEALSLLSTGGAPILALIDEAIDEDKGISIVRSLRRRAQAQYQYLMMLCTCDGQNELRSLLLGADSYVQTSAGETATRKALESSQYRSVDRNSQSKSHRKILRKKSYALLSVRTASWYYDD